MDYEERNFHEIEVNGFVQKGKQFDVEVTMAEDNRDVIYGVIKDGFSEPVSDAVVKLIEITREHGEEERKPVSHTFTDDAGEFLFGPLCPDRCYEILFWANKVQHVKICAECHHKGKCLKGIKLECPKHKKTECGKEIDLDETKCK